MSNKLKRFPKPSLFPQQADRVLRLASRRKRQESKILERPKNSTPEFFVSLIAKSDDAAELLGIKPNLAIKKNKIFRLKNTKKRVNITVDKALLEEAKKKLGMFGGKLSTLFNAYLSDFVKSIEKTTGESRKELTKKIKDLELRIKKIEDKI